MHGGGKKRIAGMPAVLCAIILMVCPCEASGRVFLRWGSGGRMVKPERVGWREAFQGEVEVDGASMETQILASGNGCRVSLDKVGEVFEQKGAEFFSFADVEMGWGVAVWPERKASVFVVAPRIWRSALVFIFNSRITDGDRIERGSFREIPDYPGSSVSRTAARPETGLRIRFLRTNASAGEVLSFYESSLAANGWHPMVPDRFGRSAAQMPLLYSKGGHFCCISVKTSGLGKKNVITVLMKEKRN